LNDTDKSTILGKEYKPQTTKKEAK